MLRTIKIGDSDVEMLAMASTDVYYRNIFNIDPIREVSAPDFNAADLIGMMERMAYVMAMQATHDRAGMSKLNVDGFIDWLDGFDRSEFLAAIPAVRALYEGMRTPSTSEKKSRGGQNAKTT